MSDNRNMTDLPGIYVIRNLVNGKVYVGQAVNVRRRWNIHKHLLRKGTHTNPMLQRSFLKHGEQAFSFELVETVALDRLALNAAEERQIAALGACDGRLGYNLTPTAGTNLGCKYSEESRARMRLAQKGKAVSETTRRAISKTLTGRVPSDECRAKRSLAMSGRKCSEDHIEAIRAAHRAKNETPMYEAFGKSQTLRDWADEYEINKGTLSNRIIRGGMSMTDALKCGNIKGKRNDLK